MAKASSKAAPGVVRIVRKARTGRTVSDATRAAHATLSDLFATGARSTVEVCDEAGEVIDTYSAVIVEPATVGKPADYTGMVGLIRGWAQANGLSVRTSQVGENVYAIREKG